MKELLRRVDDIRKDVNELKRAQTILSFGLTMSELARSTGLVGLWMCNMVTGSRNLIEQSSRTRDLTAVGTGLTLNRDTDDKFSYVTTDGSASYWGRADTAFNLSGTESEVGASYRGHTIHLMLRAANITGTKRILGKADSGSNSDSNYLLSLSGSTLTYNVYNGANTVSTTATIAASTWYHVVARYIPSTSITLFLNNVASTNSTGIYASLNTSTEDFVVGAGVTGGAPGNYFGGDLAAIGLCKAQLSDAWVSIMWRRLRAIYGI